MIKLFLFFNLLFANLKISHLWFYHFFNIVIIFCLVSTNYSFYLNLCFVSVEKLSKASIYSFFWLTTFIYFLLELNLMKIYKLYYMINLGKSPYSMHIPHILKLSFMIKFLIFADTILFKLFILFLMLGLSKI